MSVAFEELSVWNQRLMYAEQMRRRGLLRGFDDGLTKDDLAEMWLEFYKAGRPKGTLREVLIRHYWPLAKRIAGTMSQNYPQSVDREDVESWACAGLIRATERYDPTKFQVGKTVPVVFETFAVASMRSCILDELRKIDWAPRSLRKKQRDIEKARAELQHETEGAVSDEALAQRLEITVETLRSTLAEISSSWHSFLDEENEHESSPIIEPAPEEMEVTVQLRSVLVSEMRRLSETQQTVLALHYYEEQDMATVASLLGLTSAAAHQLHAAAIGQIWRSMVESLGVDLLPYVG